MTTNLSDSELETAMRAWARESIDATYAPLFTVHDSNRLTYVPTRRIHRRVLPVLAAVAVVLAVAAGFIVRHIADRNTSPASSAIRCPGQLPATAGTHRLPVAHNRPLFAHPVAAMTACSYVTAQSSGGRLRATVRLDHNVATQLAQHLNNASTADDDPLLCLAITNISILIARDNNGVALAPVTLTPGCRKITASNGATARYIDLKDAAFQQAVAQVANALRHT